jgi:hypothetical protein
MTVFIIVLLLGMTAALFHGPVQQNSDSTVVHSPAIRMVTKRPYIDEMSRKRFPIEANFRARKSLRVALELENHRAVEAATIFPYSRVGNVVGPDE